MTVSENPIEEIKEKLDITKIIGSYLKLKKTGANYSAPCPFHSEEKPSFFVSPARQVWKCFGCGEGGSVFDFVMKIEGVEFGDALRILAKKAGVQLKPRDPKVQTRRRRLYEICDLSCQFFEKQLESGNFGKKAKEYLTKRGINEESIKKWRLGYSPDTWRGLSDFLVGKGYKREEVVSVGLAVKSDKSKTPYDRFRGRITFPVFDLHSQVIGFGGRIFKNSQEKETAKYLNVPQTSLYNKSKILYGLNNAKVEIRKENQCILAEGYTDVIISHQAGFKNTVATSGTALTSSHLEILKRYSENLVLAFDMDIAGNTATKRGIDLAQKKGFDIKVIKMPSDSDPADIISDSPEKWKKALEESQSIMEFYFNSAFSMHDKETAKGKKEISRIILPVIKRIPNKIEQSHWVQKLSKEIKVKEEEIFEELKKAKTSNNNYEKEKNNTSQKKKRKKGRKEILEKRLFSLLMKKPDCLNRVKEKKKDLFSEDCQKIIEEFEKSKKNDFNKIISNLQDKSSKEIKEFLMDISFDSEFDSNEPSEIEQEVKTCIFEIESIETRKKLTKISEDIRIAEQENNNEKVAELIKKFNELTQQL